MAYTFHILVLLFLRVSRFSIRTYCLETIPIKGRNILLRGVFFLSLQERFQSVLETEKVVEVKYEDGRMEILSYRKFFKDKETSARGDLMERHVNSFFFLESAPQPPRDIFQIFFPSTSHGDCWIVRRIPQLRSGALMHVSAPRLLEEHMCPQFCEVHIHKLRIFQSFSSSSH